MTIASGGTVFTQGAAAASSTFSTTGTPAAVAVGDALVIHIACDNTLTTDSSTANEILSITDNRVGLKNVYIKAGEYINGEGGAAAGVTTAQFFCPNIVNEFTGDVGENWTITFANAITPKCVGIWKFTKASGTWLWPVAVNYTATDVVNGFGSLAISGLASLPRLYFRNGGKESNSTTALTPTSTWTVGNGTRSSTAGSAVLCRSEFKIATSTGETSDPTHAVAQDSASVLVAYEEVNPKNIGLRVLQAVNRSNTF